MRLSRQGQKETAWLDAMPGPGKKTVRLDTTAEPCPTTAIADAIFSWTGSSFAFQGVF
jgi:hypothetical protein